MTKKELFFEKLKEYDAARRDLYWGKFDDVKAFSERKWFVESLQKQLWEIAQSTRLNIKQGK